MWQDGAGPQSGLHPAALQHILGPDADNMGYADAVDFWRGPGPPHTNESPTFQYTT